MIVTIFRHGEAGEARSDRLRELTDVGQDDVAFACHQLNAACAARTLPRPQCILHSSWMRTTQSASILAAAFSQATVSIMDALQPGGTALEVDAALTALCRDGERPEHSVLVSHQPLVSQLLAFYLGEPGQVPGLSPGGLATLSLEASAAGCGTLLYWGLPPQYEMGL